MLTQIVAQILGEDKITNAIAGEIAAILYDKNE